MSTLINIKTGQTVSGRTRGYATKGDTVQDTNGNLYVVKKISLDYGTTLNTEATSIKITTIAVAFENNRDKLYHYFITRDELSNYKIGDKIKINTPFGVSTVILVDKNINIDHSRATKLIDILTSSKDKINTDCSRITKWIDVPSTPKPSYKTVATVVYENDSNYYEPKRYDYIVDNNSCLVKVNHKYNLYPNHSIVTVVNIRTTDKTEGLLFKTFIEIPQCNSTFEDNSKLTITDTTTEKIMGGVDFINELVDKRINTINEIMEEKTMNFNTNKIFKNFEFGKINTDTIKFSLNGLAFKMSDGSYATYDIEKKEATDVSAFVMDTDFIFAMPVALKDIKKGDIIKHLGKFMIVEGIFAEDKTLSVIDPLAAEEKVLIPIKNAFGFSYYTKIVNIFDGADFKPSEDMPFGNMLPFMLMNEGNMDNSMLFAMMMMNKDSAEMDFMKNPFMMMALLNK